MGEPGWLTRRRVVEYSGRDVAGVEGGRGCTIVQSAGI